MTEAAKTNKSGTVPLHIPFDIDSFPALEEIAKICQRITGLVEWNSQDPNYPKFPRAMQQHGVSAEQRTAYNSITHEQWKNMHQNYANRNQSRGSTEPPITYDTVAEDILSEAQFAGYRAVNRALETASAKLRDCANDIKNQINDKGYADIPEFAAPRSTRSR